jgi:glycosyltransferase involved in cell wall biosynthesis
MKVTVILCTYNRCQSLAEAIESIVAQVMPDHAEWNVLVVDNNSNDETRTVVENFCGIHPGRLRYLFEAQPGKSNALNSGIREADGDILAFIDDDVLAAKNWLQELTGGLQSGQYSGSGGRILADRNFPAPRWLPLQDRYGLAPLAFFDLGEDSGPLTEAPFGTNMAFSKALFQKYGGFRTDLGPRPGSEIRAEDTEFGSRLLAASEPLGYAPSAVVYHTVPENRLRKSYFLKWWFAKGQTEFRTGCTSIGIRRSIAGISFTLARRFAVWVLRWLGTHDSAARFSAKLKVWRLAGQIVESYRQRNGLSLAGDHQVKPRTERSALV